MAKIDLKSIKKVVSSSAPVKSDPIPLTVKKKKNSAETATSSVQAESNASGIGSTRGTETENSMIGRSSLGLKKLSQVLLEETNRENQKSSS